MRKKFDTLSPRSPRVLRLRVKSIAAVCTSKWNYHLGIQLARFTRLISFRLFPCQSRLGKPEIWASWMNRSEYSKFYLVYIPRLSALLFHRHFVTADQSDVRDCCADVRGWSVSCREIGIEFQSNWIRWFPLWNLCVKVDILQHRHPTKQRNLLIDGGYC